MRPTLKYHLDYSEPLTTKDGTRVTLRLLRADDRGEVLKAFEALTDCTRYRRFHHNKRELSDDELTWLTMLDQWNHVALIAVVHAGQEDERIVGVSRFIRLSDGGDTAEVAITVVDAFQRRGIGKALLKRLICAAAERGVQRLHFYVLSSNSAARGLIMDSSFASHVRDDLQGVTVIELKVPKRPRPQTLTGLDEILRAGAGGALLTPYLLVWVSYQAWWKQALEIMGVAGDADEDASPMRSD